jgi:hypothetical protein
MHVDLPGKSEPVFRAPRANLSVQNHLYPGRAPFSASRTVRRDPGVHSRLIRAVSIRRAGQSCIWSVLNLGPGTLVTMSNGTGNHEHRREPLYIRPAVLREPDRQPMLPRLYEHAAPTGLVSQIFIRPRERCGPPRDARYRRSTGAEPPRARYNPQLQSSGRRHSLAPSIACTESTLIARAGVYRSARLWARWNHAALPPRVLPLGLGCPARKRAVWACRQVVSAAALAAKAIGGPQVALGRAGDGPRAFPGWEAGLGGALRRQGRRSSRGRLSRDCKSQKFGLEGWGC